jgi:hypothetical protein
MTDNELVAKFMDNPLKPNGSGLGRFEYDTSWNALMPVSKKIEDILFDILPQFGYNDECLASNDIEARYYAVIEFIKWYNNIVQTSKS